MKVLYSQNPALWNWKKVLVPSLTTSSSSGPNPAQTVSPCAAGSPTGRTEGSDEGKKTIFPTVSGAGARVFFSNKGGQIRGKAASDLLV